MPSCSPTARPRTTLGWLAWAAMFTSRSKRLSIWASLAIAAGRILSDTMVLSARHLAL